MITFRKKGSYDKTQKYLRKLQDLSVSPLFDVYGLEGVAALTLATPKDTGLTAMSWSYKVTKERNRIILSFHNSNIKKGWLSIAIILQYGHYTGTGGWVEGRDYINPAIRPIFDALAKELWKEVVNK